MDPIPEKRRFERVHFPGNISVFPVHPVASENIYEIQKGPLPAVCLDISEGGLQLEWEGELHMEYLLKLRIEFGPGQPLEVYGKVVWTQDRRCGVRFMIIDQAIQHGVRALSPKKG